MSKKTKKEIEENIEKKDITNENFNDNRKLVKSVIVIITLIILLLIINIFFGNALNVGNKKKDISKVKKIINEKYDEILCTDENCNYVVAIKGNGLNKTLYSVFSINGKKITQFSINYKKTNESSIKIVGVTKNYLITRTTTNDGYSYSLRTLRGKVKYSSSNLFSILNEKYVAVKEKDRFLIINNKGKTIYRNVDSYNKVDNGEYLFIKKGDSINLINSKNEIISKKYELIKEEKDENNKTMYLIVKNIEKDNYNVFNTKKGKIIGNSFVSFSKLNKDLYIVTNKEGESFYLKQNTKQEKMSDTDKNNSSNIYEKLKKKVDNKYYTYYFGIKNINQDNILVKNKDENSFGTLNIKNKKYNKLFDFKEENKSATPTVSEIDSKDNIIKITCTDSNCDKSLSIILNLDTLKTLYKDIDNNVVISNYLEYDNEYKVIKYSYLSTNKDLSGKYVLLNDKNKEILKSDNPIIVVDRKLIVGEETSNDSILYSANNNSKINSKDNLATISNLNGNIVYKYNKKNKTIILDYDGKELIKTNLNNYMTYSNSNIIYMDDNKIYVYNLDKSKLKYYKLKDGDNLNNENGDFISPYRGAIFVNNSDKKRINILNSKANVLRKINGVELSSIRKNEEKGIVLIIVKKTSKNNDKYGLYIAK